MNITIHYSLIIMEVFYDLDSFPSSLLGGAVSIGKFDGIHLGHALIVQRLKSHARRLRAPTVIVTFDPSPISVLRPDLAAKPICTLNRKIELIDGFDLDALLVLKTDENLLRQSAETFFYDTLQKRLCAKVVVEGRNFYFGRDRIGDAEAIRLYGSWTGIEVDIVEPVRLGDKTISSSGIRELLRNGKVEQVAELMPQPYRLTGTVVTGRQRGATLGFPTANLDQVETIIPKIGVYATVVYLDEKTYASTTHIGPNPTFQEAEPKIEVFLHHFSGDLYGKTIDVDFLAFLREIVRFENSEDLVRQMNLDIRRSGEISASRTQR